MFRVFLSNIFILSLGVTAPVLASESHLTDPDLQLISLDSNQVIAYVPAAKIESPCQLGYGKLEDKAAVHRVPHKCRTSLKVIDSVHSVNVNDRFAEQNLHFDVNSVYSM